MVVLKCGTMADEQTTLFGFPVLITDAAPKDTVILRPLPTYHDLLEHGSLEKYVEARKKEFAMLKLDNEVLSADEVI
jgi:hypothetical protein